jgi:hypothetical protein
MSYVNPGMMAEQAAQTGQYVHGGTNPDAQLAERLDTALRAAPQLRKAPPLALAVAQHGGNVTDNARAVSVVAQQRAFKIASDRENQLQRDAARYRQQLLQNPTMSVQEYEALQHSQQGPKPPAPKPPAPKQNPASPRYVGPAAGAPGTTSMGPPEPGASLAPSPRPQAPKNAAALGVTMAGAGTVEPNIAAVQHAASALGEDVTHPKSLAQSVGQIVNMPLQWVRYMDDVYRHHGPLGVVEALAPTVLTGAATWGAGSLIADGGEAAATAEGAAAAEAGAESAGGLVARTVGPEGAVAGAANVAGRQIMQGVAGVTKGALRVPGAALNAASKVATSPAVLGGEAGGYAGARIMFPNSWHAAANPNYLDPVTHQPISAGRIAANILGLQPHSVPWDLVSGSVDAAYDAFMPDPLGATGRVIGKARSAEGFAGTAVGKLFPSTAGRAMKTSEDVDRLWQYSTQARNAFTWIGQHTPGEIIRQFPQFAPLVHKYAGQFTGDLSSEDVKNIFASAARVQEFRTNSLAPTEAFLRQVSQANRGVAGAVQQAAAGVPIAGRVAKRLTGLESRLPDVPAFDEDRLVKMSNREFDLGSPEAVPHLMNLLHAAGTPERVVQGFGDALTAEHDPQIQLNMIASAFKDAVASAAYHKPTVFGSLADPQAKKIIDDGIDNQLGARAGGRNGFFVTGRGGTDLSLLENEKGDTVAAGTALNQQRRITFPTLANLRDLALNARHAKVQMTAHQFGEYLNHAVNDLWFRPLALLTGGFAGRIALGESMMNVARQGPINFSLAQLAASAAEHGWRLNNKELGVVRATVGGILGGVEEGVVRAVGRKELLDAAVRAVMTGRGHVAHEVVSAMHGPTLVSDDVPEQFQEDIHDHALRTRRSATPSGPGYRPKGRTEDFGHFDPGQNGFYRVWSEYLGRWGADPLHRTAAQVYLAAMDRGMDDKQAYHLAAQAVGQEIDRLPEAVRRNQLRDRLVPKGSTLAPHAAWARAVVSGLEGATYGADDTFHKDLMRWVAEGRSPHWPELKQYVKAHGFENDQLPTNLPGRLPYISFAGTHFVEKLAAMGHRRLLSPFINHLSRNPLYTVELAKARKELLPAIRSGALSSDQAWVTAESRAALNSLRFVHNIHDRTRLSDMFKGVVPFYFAQEQAFRRAGRLFKENPGAFEQYFRSLVLFQHFAFEAQQANGTPFFVIPGSVAALRGVGHFLNFAGWNPFGSTPVGLTGTIDVSPTVNPAAPFGLAMNQHQSVGSAALSAVRPGFGPLVGIPLKGVQEMFAATHPAVSRAAAATLGPIGANEGMWRIAATNSILANATEALAGWAGASPNGVGSVYAETAMSVAAYEATRPEWKNLDPTNPYELGRFMSKVRLETDVAMVFRLGAAAVSPVSIGVGRAGEQYYSLAQKYYNRYPHNAGRATDAFLHDHPDLWPYLVSTSASTAEGYPLIDVRGPGYAQTVPAAKWLAGNMDFVRAYPRAAMYFMPSTAANAAYDYSASTLQMADGLRTRMNLPDFIKQLEVSSGNNWFYSKVFPGEQQALAHTPRSQQQAIYNKATALENAYGKQNPVWLSEFNSYDAQTNRVRVADDIHKIFTTGAAKGLPHDQQFEDIRTIDENFQSYSNAKATAATAAERADMKAQWQQWCAAEAQANPDVRALFTDVYAHLG